MKSTTKDRKESSSTNRRAYPCAQWIAFLVLAQGAGLPAWGQQALQMSLAGEAAAAALRKANTTIGYYNIKLGPTVWRFSSGLGLGVTDNANLQENKQGQGDFIITPQLSTSMLWPVTEKNSLNLSLGVGYNEYVVHSSLSQLYITPGSELAFNIYVGDFTINLHDRFSISQYAYQDPTVSGTGNYSQFQNALGTSVLWDLNKVLVRGGYDHVSYSQLGGSGSGRQGQSPLGGSGSGQQGQSEVFYSNAGYQFKPEMLAGIELGASWIDYSQSGYNNAFQWNAGAFYRWQLSQYLNLQASGGYTAYEQQGLYLIRSGTTSGPYWQLGVNHRVNPKVDYTLSAGHTINVAFYGGTVDQYFVNLTPNWKFIRGFTLSTPFSYNQGTQLDQTPRWTYEWFTAGINVGRPITKKLSAGVGYTYVWRQSNQPGQNYTVNTLNLNLSYAF